MARTAVPESLLLVQETKYLEQLHGSLFRTLLCNARNLTCCTATKCIHANVSRRSMLVWRSPRRFPKFPCAGAERVARTSRSAGFPADRLMFQETELESALESATDHEASNPSDGAVKRIVTVLGIWPSLPSGRN
jgi:hypothetical protein